MGGQSYPVDVNAMIPAPAALRQVRDKLTTDTQLRGQQAKEQQQQQQQQLQQRRRWRVIYVSRNTGAAKRARQVDGEAALLQELQQELVRWTGAGEIKSSVRVVGGGGEGSPAAANHQLLRPIVELEVFTADRGVRLADTVRRFADGATQVIMGPSGAGLANMLFSRPGVDVLVFPIRALPYSFWGDLASKLGHQVHNVGALTAADISSIYIADKQAASGVAAKLCGVLTRRLEESQ